MRNIPLIFLVLVIAVMVVALLQIRQAPAAVVTIVPPEPEPVNQKAYTGRMVMPTINDIYVLENSAGRDLVQIEKYLQGRAAGLHWLASEYFKAQKKIRKKSGRNPSPAEGNVVMGIKLTLDSLGQFEPKILFSNVKNGELENLVQEHIQHFWRYTRSTSGRLEMWAPFVWKTDWNPFEGK